MTRYSPLHEKHRALAAKLADFGGWEMPIEYPSGGVINEHTAVRENVGLFDVSHLGKAEVVGSDSLEFLNLALTNDLDRIKDGQAQYTMLCDDASGGVVDDLIAYRKSSDEFLLIPNAANTAEVVKRLQAGAGNYKVTITNCHDKYGVLAVQGPNSSAVLSQLGIDTNIEYMAFINARIGTAEVIVCRTGYTGERGFEILPTWSDTPAVWDQIAEKVNVAGGLICGLGARDTLRTEMGYPLHGHELSLEITPVQASAGWAVGWKKERFWGKDFLSKERAAGASRALRGLRFLERGIPRLGMTIRSGGDSVGVVTSGTFSPTLKCGIALGLIKPEIEIGSKVEIDVRGRLLSAEVTKPPFVASKVK